MTYPAHALLQFGGPRTSTSEETWSCGIRMVPVGGDLEPGELLDYLTTICVPALAGWFARVGSRISSNTKLAFAKLNRIAPDGTYADTLTVQYFWPTAVSGGWNPADTAAMVAQAALCVTWETDTVSRGLASKGRIYTPTPAVKPDPATGLFPINDALLVATSAAQLISDLRGDSGAGSMTPNIVSDVGAGVAHRIDSASCDNRVDIIRKRASSLHPARSRVAVPA